MLSTTLHSRPAASICGLAFQHLVERPCTAVIQMVQSADDADRACLPHMGERHRIVRTKPSPGLLHVDVPVRAAASIAAPMPACRIVSRWAAVSSTSGPAVSPSDRIEPGMTEDLSHRRRGRPADSEQRVQLCIERIGEMPGRKRRAACLAAGDPCGDHEHEMPRRPAGCRPGTRRRQNPLREFLAAVRRDLSGAMHKRGVGEAFGERSRVGGRIEPRVRG